MTKNKKMLIISFIGLALLITLYFVFQDGYQSFDFGGGDFGGAGAGAKW